MRAIRLSLLSLRKLGYIKSRCVVFFIMSIFVPGIICLYWLVALRDNPDLAKVFTPTKVVTYYITIIVLNSLLVTHRKEWIMEYDIQNGGLSAHLLRPYSYYWQNLIISELPYRLLQAFYGIIVIAVVVICFPQIYVLSLHTGTLPLAVLSGIMGFFICANLEMILGIMTFWFYDMRLLYNAYDVFSIILTGINMPLYLYPHFFEQIAHLTPFPSIIYIPTLILTEQATRGSVPTLLVQQVVWLVLTTTIYKIVWKMGIKQFTASGS